MKSTTILFLFGLVGACWAQTNYCDPNLCYSGTHIACGNSGAFSSACPSTTAMVVMTASLKTAILQSHNEKRSIIAYGQLPGFSSATDMATMRWSDDLAELAALNVKTCVFAHDSCHATSEFLYSGQNLYMSYGSAGSDENDILKGINMWWDEYKKADMSNMNYLTMDGFNKGIGHFTVMAEDNNYAVGCAAIRFPQNGWSSMTLACNYASNNWLNVPVYIAGPTGSGCKSGTNPAYPALCSLSEKYTLMKF